MFETFTDWDRPARNTVQRLYHDTLLLRHNSAPSTTGGFLFQQPSSVRVFPSVRQPILDKKSGMELGHLYNNTESARDIQRSTTAGVSNNTSPYCEEKTEDDTMDMMLNESVSHRRHQPVIGASTTSSNGGGTSSNGGGLSKKKMMTSTQHLHQQPPRLVTASTTTIPSHVNPLPSSLDRSCSPSTETFVIGENCQLVPVKTHKSTTVPFDFSSRKGYSSTTTPNINPSITDSGSHQHVNRRTPLVESSSSQALQKKNVRDASSQETSVLVVDIPRPNNNNACSGEVARRESNNDHPHRVSSLPLVESTPFKPTAKNTITPYNIKGTNNEEDVVVVDVSDSKGEAGSIHVRRHDSAKLLAAFFATKHNITPKQQRKLEEAIVEAQDSFFH